MAFQPKHEQITGADLTGVNKTANRTYTLANSDAQSPMFAIIIENAALQQGVDYTLSSDVVTFLNKVFDFQNITLDYLVYSSVTGSDYTDTLQVARVSGLGVAIENESLGVGTSANKSFDLDNGNVIAGSYTLKYSTTGTTANSFTTLTESTHYALDKDGGTVYLTTAGETALGKNTLYIDYMHSEKVSDTVLATYIGPAGAEVDKETGNYWGSVVSTEEVQDGRDTNPYPASDEPYVRDYDETDFIQLKFLSVQAITSIVFTTGTSTRTLDSDYYRWDEDGYITLLNDYLPLGKLNVTITYTHGYDTTPALVKELAALYAGMRAYVNISGGSYDDATSFTLGRKAITIGEAWVNIREVISQTQRRIDKILNMLGPKMSVV